MTRRRDWKPPKDLVLAFSLGPNGELAGRVERGDRDTDPAEPRETLTIEVSAEAYDHALEVLKGEPGHVSVVRMPMAALEEHRIRKGPRKRTEAGAP